MINTVIAFIILAVAMYMAFRSIDAISARFNLFPKRHKPQSQKDQLVDSICNGLELAEYSAYNHQAIANCEIEAGAVCSEVANNAEGLADGIQALAESAKEHASAILEGLSHH